MMPGTGGTPAPPPGYQPPPLPGLAAGSFSGTFRGRLVIVQGTGPNSGLFVYSGTPALGNPPIFWAASASVDPFGNVLPSTAGVAGTGLFQAGNTLITPAGLFVYSAAPAAGNLIHSVAPAAGTDAFGNAYLAGGVTYTNVAAGNWIACQAASGQLAFWGSASSAGPWTRKIEFLASIAAGALTGWTLEDDTNNMLLNSSSTGSAGVLLLSSVSGAGVAPKMVAGDPVIGGGTLETWHSLGTLAGYTVNIGRYRLLPTNEVQIQVDVTAGGANAASVAFQNALPVPYRPPASVRLNLAGSMTNTVWPNLFVSSASGSVTVGQNSANAFNIYGNVFMPLD